jgi:hypothetical protein
MKSLMTILGESTIVLLPESYFPWPAVDDLESLSSLEVQIKTGDDTWVGGRRNEDCGGK